MKEKYFSSFLILFSVLAACYALSAKDVTLHSNTAYDSSKCRPVIIKMDSTVYTGLISYDALGNLLSQKSPDNTELHVYTYDSQNRISSYNKYFDTLPNSQHLLYNYSYQYDTQGNLQKTLKQEYNYNGFNTRVDSFLYQSQGSNALLVTDYSRCGSFRDTTHYQCVFDAAGNVLNVSVRINDTLFPIVINQYQTTIADLNFRLINCNPSFLPYTAKNILQSSQEKNYEINTANNNKTVQVSLSNSYTYNYNRNSGGKIIRVTINNDTYDLQYGCE